MLVVAMMICSIEFPGTVQKIYAQSIDNATDYTLGTIQYGMIAESEDRCQFYKFTLQESGKIQILGTAYMECMSWELYDESANKIWDRDTWWNSVSAVISLNQEFYLTSGTYYLCIGRECTGGKYSFRINFTSAEETFHEVNGGSDNTLSDANTIDVNGSLYKGMLGQNDTKDFYKFTLPSSGRIKFSASFSDIRCVYWKIYDESGEELYSKNPLWNETTRNIVVNEDLDLIGGTYYLSISCDDACEDRYGSYSFSMPFISANETYVENNWESNNTIDTAAPLEIGKTYQGQLAINDSRDFYVFNVPTSQTLSVRVECPIEEIQVNLYDSQGNDIWYEYPDWNSATNRINFKKIAILEKGTYYLAVVKSGDGGNYTLGVSKLTQDNCPHDYYDKQWHKATYFSQGYCIHTCRDCGYTYKDEYTAALKLPKGSWNYYYKCSAGKGSLILYWSTVSDATGYQIRYCKSKSFKSGVGTKTIKGSAKYHMTISRLSRNKTYYVQVRPYKKSGSKTVYGAWSSTRKFKTR